MKCCSPVIATAFSVLASVTLSVNGQTPADESVRPRVVTRSSAEVAKPKAQTAVQPQIEEFVTAETPNGSSNNAEENPSARLATFLTPQLIRSRISEAERFLKSQPKQTALASPSTEFVTVAALERSTGRIHLLNISKLTFLKKGSEITLPSSLGTQLTLRVLRANGVNTAVTIFDSSGQSLVPLVVEFPIERRGVFREMAYYTSAHPALLSSDLTITGRAYVRNMLDLAARRLRDKGMFISPQLVDVAERLCLVEHVDHFRFRQENRAALYDEIYSLYALNELDTYRYSVSFAGAGGMVQMIPWAYNLMRQRHPGVGLIPDFVVGMRNHGNALQAMLLYMHDTWNDLSANTDVQYALNAKLATQPELLAAGYNSNAAKLPGYIRRGGNGWRTLIPRETQMYLQIYKSVESLVPMKPRTSIPTAQPEQ
ncbi:MAG TPA: hypothetical protein VJ023_18185 [Pyrinomonadaceae bacterium]|nr:hypothetical protein [Pyrinomonadaceae bacterium]